jgi:uncharacterized protein (DUF2141 family)
MKNALAAVAAMGVMLAAGSPAAAQVLGSDAEACEAGNAPAIRVNVTGLKDRTGRLKLELYPGNDTDFLRDDRDLIHEGKTFRRVWVNTPPAGPVSICIRVPRPGRYGLFFTHDRDGKNKFNIWSDGAGVASNSRIGAAKPKLAASQVDVGNGVATINIVAQYIHGLSGFAPSHGGH